MHLAKETSPRSLAALFPLARMLVRVLGKTYDGDDESAKGYIAESVCRHKTTGFYAAEGHRDADVQTRRSSASAARVSSEHPAPVSPQTRSNGILPPLSVFFLFAPAATSICPYITDLSHDNAIGGLPQPSSICQRQLPREVESIRLHLK